MLKITSVSQERCGNYGADVTGELNGCPLKAYVDFQLLGWRGYIITAKVTLLDGREVQLANHLTVAAPPTVDGREVEPGLFLSADDQKRMFESCKDLKRPYPEKTYLKWDARWHEEKYLKWDY